MSIPDWRIEGTMDKAQRDALLHALEAHDFHMSRAVAQLRIGRSTAYRLMERFEISRPDRAAAKAGKEGTRQSAQVMNPLNTGSRSAGGPVKEEIVFDGSNYLLVRR